MSDRPLPTIIGPTENALRALLVRALDAVEIETYEEWVYVNMTASGASPDLITSALGSLQGKVVELGDRLVQRGLLCTPGELSEVGAVALAHGRERVVRITAQLTHDIDPDHVQLCGQVLDQVRANAEHMLAEAASAD